MKKKDYYKKQLEAFQNHKCEFTWDELEEIITQDFEDGLLSSEEYDEIMKKLMECDCEE